MPLSTGTWCGNMPCKDGLAQEGVLNYQRSSSLGPVAIDIATFRCRVVPLGAKPSGLCKGGEVCIGRGALIIIERGARGERRGYCPLPLVP